jgi:hypothetical protein
MTRNLSRWLAALGAVALAAPAAHAMLKAAVPVGAPYLVCQSAAPGMSHTGSTTETTLATCAIPAGAMGANGCLEVDAYFTYTNSVSTKTIRARFSGAAGSIYGTAGATTNAGTRFVGLMICNRNAADSQVGTNGASYGWPPITSAADTTAATTLVLTGHLANAADTVSLESYSVKLQGN